MADIDNLNFKVILDDSQFNRQIKKVEAAAKQFNTTVSRILTVNAATSKFGKNLAGGLNLSKKELKQIQQLLGRIGALQQGNVKLSKEDLAILKRLEQSERERVKTLEQGNREKIKTQIEEEKLRTQVERTAAAHKRATGHIRTQNGLMRQLATYAGTYVSVLGAGRFLRNMVEITGQFETQRVALRTILQDANGADAIYDRMKALAIESPYTFMDLTSYAKQLSAFSIPMNELYDTTKRLADVSAGLGVDMSRIILAYGQVRAASFLRGQEVRQFTEAGIPILEELAKQFEKLEGHAVSAGQVFEKISARQVPFEMVKKAFVDMTDAGGKFYNMQSVLSETLTGKINKVKDAWQIMIGDLGEANHGVFANTLDWTLKMIRNYDEFGRKIATLIVALGSWKAAWTVFDLVINKHVTSWVRLLSVIRKTAAMQAILKFIANPWAALGTVAFTGVAIGTYSLLSKTSELERAQNNLAKSANEVGSAYAKSAARLRYLNDEMTTAKRQMEDANKLADDNAEKQQLLAEASERYDAARKEIIQNYNPYIQKITAEKGEIKDLTEIYDDLTAAVKKSSGARYVQSQQTKIEEYKQTKTNKIDEDLDDLFKNNFTLKHLEREANRLEKEAAKGGRNADAAAAQAVEKRTQADELRNYMRGYVYGNIKRDEIPSWIGAALIYDWGDFTKLHDRYASIESEAKTMEDRARRTALAIYGYKEGEEETVKATAELAEWQKQAQEVLKKAGLASVGEDGTVEHAKAGNLWTDATMNADYYDWLDDIRKAYKDYKQRYIDAPSAELKAANKQMVDAIVALSKTVGGGFSLTEPNVGGKKGTSEEQKAKDALQARIDLLKEMKEMYDTYKALGVSDGGMKPLFEKFFPDASASDWKDFDFADKLNALADSLENLGDKSAAQSLRDWVIGKDWRADTNALKNAQKELEKFQEFVKNLGTKTSNIFGEGLQRDVLKINSDTAKANAKIDKEAEERRVQLVGKNDQELAAKKAAYEAQNNEVSWDEYVRLGKKAIEEWAENEKKVNRETAQDKVNNLAQAYMTALLKDKNINLQDWGDKSLAQIRSIFKDLEGILEGSTVEKLFDANARAALEKDGVDLTVLLEKIVKLVKQYMAETTDEGWKKVSTWGRQFAKTFSEIGSTIENAADSFEDLSSGSYKTAKAIGSVFTQLGASMSAISEMSDGLKAVFSGEKVGLTDALAAGGQLLSMVANAYASVIAAQERLRRETEEWEMALKRAEYELVNIQINQLDFAEKNPLSTASAYDKAASAQEKMRRTLEEMQKVYDTIGAGKIQVGQRQVIDGVQTAAGAAGGALAGAAAGAIIGSAVPVIGTAVGAIVGGLIGLFSGGASAGASSARMEPIFATLSEKYGSLLEEGTRNFQLKAEIMADYAAGKLDEQTEAAIDQLENLRGELEEAIDLVNESITDVVGDLSKNLSDAIAEAFTNGNIYDAVDAFHDYLTNAIQDLIMQVAMSRFVQPLLDELYEGMLGSVGMKLDENGKPYYAGGGDNDYTDDFKKFEDGLAEVMPGLEEYLNAARDAMMTLGDYNIFSGDSKNNTLAGGIKSITEDTANLLASYLNAIRADVSYGKTQWERIAVAVEGQSTRYITLNDYLMQVQANTANIAESNRQILSEIQGFIRDYSLPSGMGDSIKVQIVN